MARFPGAQWVGGVPSSNYAPGPSFKIGMVVHVIVGSASSAVSEFQTTGAQLSAHFVVAGPGDRWPDGTVLQLLDTDANCYAQASGNYPPTAYIAVEFAGIPPNPMTPAQMTAGAAIAQWASGVYGFPLVGPVAHGTPGITPHCNPNGTPDPAWGNHSCPGPVRLAQIPAMIAAAALPSADVPITNDWLIRHCYRVVLHREVDLAGYNTWLTFLDKGGDPGEMWAKVQDSAEGVAVLSAERKSIGLTP